MRTTVREKIRSWLTGKGATGEGSFNWMHKDSLGYVTIGIGNKIQPLSDHPLARNPSLYRRKGEKDTDKRKAVTPAEIQADYDTVSKVTQWENEAKPFYGLTKLRLSAAGLTRLFTAKLESMENNLKKYPAFTAFDQWPADAQMGLLGMAWALGEGGTAGKKEFALACLKGDFATAAEKCRYYPRKGRKETASARRRNTDHKTMFHNAAWTLYEIIEMKQGSNLLDRLLFDKSYRIPKEDWKPPQGWPPVPPLEYRKRCETMIQ